ncbi:hypothetical protein GCM10010129_70960 [Streptomyces fumigatiscleroticus]|nr:hypothetical protein GCM10010129_70960 [Streptomyces fumigatiscleroticus]
MNPVPATAAIPGCPSGTRKADPAHSQVAFTVRHLMVSRMRGRFTGTRRTGGGRGVDGEPTLHGVSRQVPPAVEVNGSVPHPWGGRRAGFSATGARSAWRSRPSWSSDPLDVVAAHRTFP